MGGRTRDAHTRVFELEGRQSAFDFRIVSAVATKFPGWRKLAQLVTHHVLSNENRGEFLAIVDEEVVTHEFGGNHGTTRPGFDRTLLSGRIHSVDFEEELVFDKRSFFQ